MLKRFVHGFESGLVKLLSWTSRLGAIILFLVASGIFLDVVKRWFTSRPVIGVYEGVEVSMVIVTFLLLPTVQYYGRQLSVDIVYAHTRGRLSAFMRFFQTFFSLCVFSALLYATWNEFLKALFGRFLRRGIVEIPSALPMGFMVLGSFLLVLIVILFFLRTILDLATGGRASVPPKEEVIVPPEEQVSI